MDLLSIKCDVAMVLYHPDECVPGVGGQLAICEMNPEVNQPSGVIVQCISHELIDYFGIESEILQRVLERRAAETMTLVDREEGVDALSNLKVAKCKIRKLIRSGKWVNWDGWIPSRAVTISFISDVETLQQVMPSPGVPMQCWAMLGDEKVIFDGPGFDQITAIVAAKGRGKSHCAKHLVMSLADKGVPALICDINGEYTALPRAQVLRWKDNFRLSLSEVGHKVLSAVVHSMYPFSVQSPSAGVWENNLPAAFQARRAWCNRQGQRFTIDIGWLQESGQWGTQQFVVQAIRDRLDAVGEAGLFADEVGLSNREAGLSFSAHYERACEGEQLVLDMRNLSDSLRHAFVRAIITCLESVADREMRFGRGRLPYLILDEAQDYLTESGISSLMTRARHLGIASVFVSNSPDRLPEQIFRHVDSLILLGMHHLDDLRAVSKSSFADRETVESVCRRLPEHHALVVGRLTGGYPLVLKILPHPEGTVASGVTRSTWDRFRQKPV